MAEAVSNETSRYTVKLMTGPEIRTLITKVNAKGLGKVFDEHYTKHPVSKLVRQYEAPDDFMSVIEKAM